MALINELIDFGKLAKQLASQTMDPNDAEYVAKAAKVFQKAKAISATANKYTVVYPVLVSTQIDTLKTALAITKQIELECARFIILAAGLQPLIGDSSKNAEISNKLNSLFTGEALKNLKLELKEAGDEEFYSTEHYLNNYFEMLGKKSFGESRFIKSFEMQDVDTVVEDGEEDELNEDEKDFARKKMGIDPDKEIKNNPDKKDDIKDNVKKSYDKELRIGYTGNELDNNLTKLTAEGPTIIKLKFVLSKENTTIEIPMAVKAVIKYVDSSDCIDILKRSKTFSSRFMNIIRVISGELCFKDWLFQFDEAKKDVEREKELNHLPWYRNLIKNKHKNKTKSILGIFNVTNDFVKGKNHDDMPMCTMIFNGEDIEKGIGMPFNKVLAKPETIFKFIDEYMLLGIGVYIQTEELLYLFFAGEPEYRMLDINKIGINKNSKDTTSVLVDMLAQTYRASLR